MSLAFWKGEFHGDWLLMFPDHFGLLGLQPGKDMKNFIRPGFQGSQMLSGLLWITHTVSSELGALDSIAPFCSLCFIKDNVAPQLIKIRLHSKTAHLLTIFFF